MLGSFFSPKPKPNLYFGFPNVNSLQFSYNCDLICNNYFLLPPCEYVSFPTSSCSRTRLLQIADSENNNKMSGAHVRVDCPVIYHTFSTFCLHWPCSSMRTSLLPLPCIVIGNNDFIPYIFIEWTWQGQEELLLWRLLKYHLHRWRQCYRIW